MGVGDWCISILAVVVNDWRISIPTVLTRRCSPTRLWFGSAVVFFDRMHTRSRNFNSAISIDIVSVKSNVNDLFYPTGPGCSKQG